MTHPEYSEDDKAVICEHCCAPTLILLWIYVRHPYDADLGTCGQAQWWCKACVERA